MRIIISPAKQMRVDTDTFACTELPAFMEKTVVLKDWIRALTYEQQKALWACNDKIAQQNAERFAHMDLRDNLTPALLAYDGIQYTYMAPAVFEDGQFDYVQEHLRMDLWLVPSDVYTTINVGISELELKVAPYGAIGRHLFDNLITYNLSEIAGWTQGESWSLGDSPEIAIAINPGCGRYVETQAPLVVEDTSSISKADNPVIRIYTSADSRYILEDFFAKLRLYYGK